MKKTFILIQLIMLLQSCKSQVATMYGFSYFKDSPVWNLAKAVEDEDTFLIKKLVKEKGIDINYKETRYDGNTLLITAVSNGKLNSVIALLKLGADIKYVNKSGVAAIHVACNFPSKEAKSLEILRVLLDNDADPNQIEHGTGNNKGFITTPLALATYDSACANLLLERGADLYFKANDTYVVWDQALSWTAGDGIFFMKDLILDKKVKAPLIISYDVEHLPNNIFTYLEPDKFPNDPYNTFKKSKCRNDILLYLKQIEFPKNQIYSDK